MRQRDLWRERLARALSLALKAVSMARPQGRQRLNVSLSLPVSMSRCLMSPQVSGLRSQVSHSFPRPAAPMARHRIAIGPRAAVPQCAPPCAPQRQEIGKAIGPRPAKTFRDVARAPSPLHEPRTTNHEPRKKIQLFFKTPLRGPARCDTLAAVQRPD